VTSESALDVENVAADHEAISISDDRPVDGRRALLGLVPVKRSLRQLLSRGPAPWAAVNDAKARMRLRYLGRRTIVAHRFAVSHDTLSWWAASTTSHPSSTIRRAIRSS
jgi:hypothetical protein